jgi:predicted molibdopterin-dependent oxidoreductase YjgC
MFRRFDDGGSPIAFTFEGEPLTGQAGDSVAAALLAAGMREFRTTPVSAAPRGPWCMMGVCFDCLVEIDGVPNRQACMIPLAEGMRVSRQLGARSLA